MIHAARSICAFLAAGIVAFAAGTAPARASSVDAPDAVVDGKTVDQWTEGWWTWAAGLPANHNAFNDPTGVFAHQQNNGPVFYLPGYFSLPAGYTEPPVQRSLTVRAGEPGCSPACGAAPGAAARPAGWSSKSLTRKAARPARATA